MKTCACGAKGLWAGALCDSCRRSKKHSKNVTKSVTGSIDDVTENVTKEQNVTNNVTGSNECVTQNVTEVKPGHVCPLCGCKKAMTAADRKRKQRAQGKNADYTNTR